MSKSFFGTTAFKQEGLDGAKATIDRMFQKIEVPEVYTGKVVSIT